MTTVIEDRIASLLIRHLRVGAASAFERPRLDYLRDLGLIRMYWSLSPAVCSLASYFNEHRHEAVPERRETKTYTDGMLRGRYDPVGTALLAAKTGIPHRTVCLEPERSFDTGENRVLGWTLRAAISLLREAKARIVSDIPQATMVRDCLSAIEPAVRLLATLDSRFAGGVLKPSSRDLLSARRSRNELYRRAAETFDLLQKCEAGDLAAVRDVLTKTVIGPAKPWQKFELLMLASMADALGIQLGVAPQFRMLTPDDRSAVAVVGRFSLFWQSRTDLYVEPAEEPSESRTRELLTAYGLGYAADRPDIIVVDTDASLVAAIGEAKYSADETEESTAALRQAVGQVVRYARGYADRSPPEELLPQSVIAVHRRPSTVTDSDSAPVLVTLDQMLSDTGLASWAAALTST